MIKLTRQADLKIKIYTRLADDEVSGLMRVEKVGDDIIVNDVIILKQESSTAETTLDEQAMTDFLTDEIKNGRNVSDIKGWWHSHADMGTFWSKTDTDNMDTLGSDWFVSIVSNKKGQVLGRIDIYQPFRVYMDKVEIETIPTPEEQEVLTAMTDFYHRQEQEETTLEAEYQEQIDEKVSKPAFKWPKNKAGFKAKDFKLPRDKWDKYVCPSEDCEYFRWFKKDDVPELKCKHCDNELIPEWDFDDEPTSRHIVELDYYGVDRG